MFSSRKIFIVGFTFKSVIQFEFISHVVWSGFLYKDILLLKLFFLHCILWCICQKSIVQRIVKEKIDKLDFIKIKNYKEGEKNN